jgi:actin-related protein
MKNDTQDLSALLSHLFYRACTLDGDSTSMFFLDAIDMNSNAREGLCELAFEEFKVDRLYLGYSPLLSSLNFASQSSNAFDVSALCIEIGLGSTRLVPVVFIVF